MDFRKWPLLILCAAGLLVAGCTAEDGSTASGSDEWSRGVIIGTTEADTVAVAAWEGTTFVAWIAESGQLRLAQLDAALGLEGVTDLALKVASIYAGDVRLEAEAGDRLHLTWEDSVDGIPTLVHARLVPGQAEPAFQQEIPLPTDAHHIETVMRLESDRLDIFWSAMSGRNSGIYHRAVSLTGDELAPVTRLTETGTTAGSGMGAVRGNAHRLGGRCGGQLCRRLACPFRPGEQVAARSCTGSRGVVEAGDVLPRASGREHRHGDHDGVEYQETSSRAEGERGKKRRVWGRNSSSCS